MHFEAPLTLLVWVTSIVSVVLTYIISSLLIPELGGNTSLWWQLSTVVTCGTLAGAIIPELVKVFTSTQSGHVREVVASSREGGASLNILSGFVAGNFSAYWLGLTIMHLNQVAVPDRDMPQRLTDVLETKKEKIVYLKADQDAQYGRVMAAFDALRKAKVENIGLIAERKAQQHGAGAPTGGGK